MANVKMSDLAKEATVSIATVGRVIHSNGYVSPDARAKVEAAVKKLGYVPNAMARALKQQKSGIIGSLVVYNQNNLYQKINNSVMVAAEQHGYKLITIEGRLNHHDEEEIINQFIGMQVDGLVITSNMSITNEMFDRLHGLSIPVVAIERTYHHPFVDNIEVKDFEGTYSATQKLIENGHTDIGLIAVALVDQVEKQRFDGYQKALADHGISANPQAQKSMPDYSIESGCNAMKELLQARPMPTAILCTADTLAAGAMQALYAAGKKVPDDISIIGYDNVIAKHLAPPIDSIDLALDSIGEYLFSLLERRMADKNCTPKTQYLDTVYVHRGTIKSIK